MLTHAVLADFSVEIHTLKITVPSHIKRSSTGIQNWELTKSYCVCVCVCVCYWGWLEHNLAVSTSL